MNSLPLSNTEEISIKLAPYLPHIRFEYGDYQYSISVLDRIVNGQAPTKVIAKVNQWIDLHEAEILTLWEKAQKGEKLDKLEPLK